MRRFCDIIPDYAEYLRLQAVDYLSMEGTNPWHADGQRRFLEIMFAPSPRWFVLDVACGDGTGLAHLQKLGFHSLAGVELSPEKARAAEIATAHRVPIYVQDMHDRLPAPDGSVDIVLSSHTLEHAYDPAKVLAEFHRVLRPNGSLIVVLPYPDVAPQNEKAHGAKYELGLDIQDEAATTVTYFENHGFRCDWKRLDNFRESEVWLVLRRQ